MERITEKSQQVSTFQKIKKLKAYHSLIIINPF